MKKRYIYFGLGFLALLVVLVLIFRGGGKPLVVSPPFTGNFRFAEAASNETIRFFTGTQFASYNLVSHQTSDLTPILDLPQVINLKWGDKGALFKAANYTGLDQLQSTLEAKFLLSDKAYWWYVPYGSNKVTLVGDYILSNDVTDVVWNDSDTYFYVDVFNEEADDVFVLVRKNTGSKSVEIGTIPAVSQLLYSSGEYIYALSGSSLIKIDNQTAEVETIIENGVVNPKINADGSAISYVLYAESKDSDGHADDTPGALIYYNLDTSQSFEIISKFNGRIDSTNGGDFLASEKTTDKKDRDSFKLIRYNTEILNSYKFEEPEGSVLSSFLPVLGDNTYVAIGGNNTASLLANKRSDDLDNLPSYVVPNEVIAAKNIYKDTFYVAYFPDKNSYGVYITISNFKRGRQDSINYLQSLGVDYRTILIKWYPLN